MVMYYIILISRAAIIRHGDDPDKDDGTHNKSKRKCELLRISFPKLLKESP